MLKSKKSNVFDHQKDKTNNYVDSEDLVLKLKSEHLVKSDEVNFNEEENDASIPPR